MPASPKQLSANCANAKLSTGPKTVAGKKAASRNALRHGLSTPAPGSGPLEGRYRALAAALTAGDVGAAAAAQQVAWCRFELDKIDGAKRYWIASSAIDMDAENPGYDVEFLEGYGLSLVAGQLLKLDRYERRIHSRMRKALRACH